MKQLGFILSFYASAIKEHMWSLFISFDED